MQNTNMWCDQPELQPRVRLGPDPPHRQEPGQGTLTQQTWPEAAWNEGTACAPASSTEVMAAST